jgi:micrococcal nuclease
MKSSLVVLALVSALAGCDIPVVLADPTDEVEIITAAGPRSHFETVTRVIDGDTFEIDSRWSPYDLIWRVRVAGIDTPEKGHRASCERERQLSTQATEMTRRLLDESLGRVRLRNVEHDKYGGRIVANVILANGKSLGDELLAARLARQYNGNGPKPNWCY